ncbi:MAG: 2-oxo-4-hydroxy-4-carboxy-5-ureidoimidazoline decarboxylase [Chloroflexota bacterium]
MKTLNELDDNDMREAFTRCCGSGTWVNRMMGQRPFDSPDDLHQKGQQMYATLEKSDYLEAFSHHPRIGGDLDKLREKFATTADWSSSEQGAVKQASEEVLQRLARGNEAYYEKFGYIFIVCATGKSAQEMLDLLEARLPNNPTDEINIAAKEQEKIMAIRLDKLLAEMSKMKSNWILHSDQVHRFSFQFPEHSSNSEPITIEKDKKDGDHRIHVYSAKDMQEVYFEVRSFSSFVEHDVLINKLETFLKEHSPSGSISNHLALAFQSFQGNEFRFEGQLQGFYKVRRFLFFDTDSRTFQIVYDPRSTVNDNILASFQAK